MKIRRSSLHLRVLLFSAGLTVLTAWHYLWIPQNPVDPPEAMSEGRRDGISQNLDISLESHISSRHLLAALPNCTPRAVEQFPRGLFTQEQREQGAIIIHVIVCIYMFLALAVICDFYFVPSLEILCDYLNLQSDVAGATFMAAGSSAPELATAVIGVFVAKDDVGLGTVVGSAIYNVMFVVSMCGLFAGMAVSLHWWPMVRDCVFYLLSVIALILVILDEVVRWYEAVGLLVLYLLYIIVMYFNVRLEQWLVPACARCCKSTTRTLGEDDILVYDRVKTNGAITEEDRNNCPESMQMLPLSSDCDSDEGSDNNPLLKRAPPSACYTVNIPDSIMALTFVAFGVSLPDVVASLIVVREGLGDMAVSNAIGSNVFDILVCLGIPWLLQTAILSPGTEIQVYSAGLTYSSITLLSTVLFLLIATHLNGWKLDKKYGAILLIVYVVYLALASLYELNIFGYFHPPECPSDY